MMSAAILAAMLAASQPLGLPLKPDEVVCGANGFHNVASKPARVQKMTELPPADLHLAVVRRVGSCSLPVIIRRDVERRTAPVMPEDAPSHRR